MAIDLQLSANNDLVFAANRDWQVVSGKDLVEQRIRIRLKIERGSWVYDDDQSLGSNLYAASGHDPDKAILEIPIFVRQALDEMDDIEVEDVGIELSDGSMDIIVRYQIKLIEEDAGELTNVPDVIDDVEQFSLTVPF